jgi:hypothetical protein
MPSRADAEAIVEKVRGLGLICTLDGDIVRLREDIDMASTGAEPQEVVWDHYCMIQDLLEECGLVLSDPYLEHDCVSGRVVEAIPVSRADGTS